MKEKEGLEGSSTEFRCVTCGQRVVEQGLFTCNPCEQMWPWIWKECSDYSVCNGLPIERARQAGSRRNTDRAAMSRHTF